MYATFAALKDAIQAETRRTDATFIGRIAEFVAMGERRLFNGETLPGGVMIAPLRCREMETRATLTFVAGTVTLPTNFLEARRITWNSTPPSILNYREPEEFYGLAYQSGRPMLFCIDGQNLDIRPAESGTATVSYYARPVGLVADLDTNAVLAAHGHVYLHSALIDAYAFLRNDAKVQESVARCAASVSGVNQASARARYAGTRLAPRIPGAVQYRGSVS